MSSNDSTLDDEDGDSSDWIELFNKGSELISLQEYYLSDDANDLEKWSFPDINISPQGHLIIFCSGKNRKESGMPLHTNFKLSAAGEDILFSKNDDLIQHLFPISLETDYSYAAIPDGSQDFFVNLLPTPGEENQLHLKIEFDKPSGFYTELINLDLNINIPFENVEIRYTTNGDIPDNLSHLYDQTIEIENRTDEENYLANIPCTPDYSIWTEEPTYPRWKKPSKKQPKGTVIRAAAFKGQEQISKTFTNTYFIFPEGQNRFSLPVLSITCPPDSLFSEKRGIYVPGDSLKPDNIVWSGNYFNSGVNWERLSNVEYFEEGSSVLNQVVGLRIHGGKTRGAAQKTLKIFARSEYGKSHLEYPFFKNKDQDSYKRILVRTSMASWGHCIIKDAFAHQLAKGLNFDIQEYQPIIVFINGEYWGLHELREKIDRFKIAEDHNLDDDSIRIYSSYGKVIEGNYDTDFYQFRDQYLYQNDITDPSVYEYVTSKVDIDNIIDYFFTEIYLNNADWPGNNSRMWRSTQLDNKWRWIYYDLDGGFGENRSQENNLQKLLDDSAPYKEGQAEWVTKVIRTLIKNQTFKAQFINRGKYLLKNYFTTERLFPILKEMENQYKNELPEHFERWEDWLTFSEWQHNVAVNLKQYILLRSCEMEAQMMDYFEIESFLDCSEVSEPEITIFPNPTNGIVNITIEQKETTVFTCQIYNSIGQLIHQQLIIPLVIQTLDISSFPNGTYFLHLIDSNSNKTFVKKLIKQ